MEAVKLTAKQEFVIRTWIYKENLCWIHKQITRRSGCESHSTNDDKLERDDGSEVVGWKHVVKKVKI